MKTSSIIAFAATAAKAVIAVKFVSAPRDWIHSNLGFNISQPEDHGDLFESPKLMGRSAEAIPLKVELKNRNPHIPGARSMKIRYGPYTVPGGRVPGGEGMIENRPSRSVAKPCSTCYILGMNAGLEYMDGKDANTDTLMWLHHMVMFNIGRGAWDATCTVFGAPHMIVGSTPQSSERFFSSGNERTTTFFNPPWANVTNLAYPIYPGDRFGLITDLMNMNQGPKQVYLTIYYDYVDGHPSRFEEVKPVWLDAAQCMTSEVSGRTPGAKFSFGSPAWNANFEGEVLGMGGHLHDGGTRLDVLVNNKVICSSMPYYGTDEQALVRARSAMTGNLAPLPESVLKGGAGAHAGMDMGKAKSKGSKAGGHGHGGLHIIAMSICAENKSKQKALPISPLGVKRVAKGQRWTLKAYYDYGLHPGMKKGTSQRMSTVMGISIMYAKTATKRRA